MKDIVITILQKGHILQKGQYLWEYLCGYLKSYIFRCFRSDLNSKFTHDFKDLANFVLKHPEKLENSLLIKTEKRLLENVNQSFQACYLLDLNSLIEKRPKSFLNKILSGFEDPLKKIVRPEYIVQMGSSPAKTIETTIKCDTKEQMADPLKEILNKILSGPEDPLKKIVRPEYIVPKGSSPAKTIETIRSYTKERMESDEFPGILLNDIDNGIREIFVAIEEFFLLRLMSFFKTKNINVEDGIYDQKSLEEKLGKLEGGVKWFLSTKEGITINNSSTHTYMNDTIYTYWDLKRFKWNLEQKDFVKNLRITVDRDRFKNQEFKNQEEFAYKISIKCDIYDVNTDKILSFTSRSLCDLKQFKENLEREDFVKNLRITVDRDRFKNKEEFTYNISIKCDIYDVNADKISYIYIVTCR